MFAFLAFAGDLGCSVGPWINGVVNDLIIENESLRYMCALGFTPEQASLRSAILISGVFPLVMFAVLVIISTHLKKSKK